MANGKYITLDFETFYGTGYSLTALTYEQYISHEKFKVHGVGLKIENEPAYYVKGPEVAKHLEALFYPGNEHTLIAHNTLFDGAIFSWYYGLQAGRYLDTMGMSNALWNQGKSGLEDISIRLFPDNPDMRKGTEIHSFKDRYNLEPFEEEVLRNYCINDVNLTWECFRKMWPMMPDEELEIMDITLRMTIHPAFVLDKKTVMRHLDKVRKEKAALIKASGTNKTVLASPQRFVAHVKKQYGLDIPIIPSPTRKNPNNVKPALAKDELAARKFIQDNPEVLPAFEGRWAVASNLEESRAVRMLEHAQQVYHKPEGVLAVPLKYAAAHTLRWGGTNSINGQNFGRGSPLRIALRAPDGYLLGIGDLSQIECRMLAWFAGQDDLVEDFRNKRDIYSIFASDIYGRPINRKRKEIDPETGKEFYPEFIEGHVGKTSVLGLGYQMGWEKFKDTLEKGANGGPPVFLSEYECRRIVYDLYRGKYRAIVNLWDEAQGAIIKMMTLNPGDKHEWRGLQIEYGRIRLFNGMYLNYPGLRWKENEQTGNSEIVYWNGQYETNIYGGKLIENIIQALARLVIARQIIRINTWLKDEEGPDSRVILTVHDEIISIMRKQGINRKIETMLDMMREPPSWCFDLPLDSEGGADVCYSK